MVLGREARPRSAARQASDGFQSAANDAITRDDGLRVMAARRFHAASHAEARGNWSKRMLVGVDTVNGRGSRIDRERDQEKSGDCRDQKRSDPIFHSRSAY